jgi:hypothetical protein
MKGILHVKNMVIIHARMDVNQPGTQEIFVRHLLMPHDYLIRHSILQ